jgi:hypothetical protein
MDRHRFSNLARTLRAFAERMSPLMKMPERVTVADLQLAADLTTKAAEHLDELVEATPPGCVCRHIKDDGYDYLDYAESCRHHGRYYRLSEKLKADYAKMENALKNETRMKLVAAALAGTAAPMVTDAAAPEGWTSVTGPTTSTLVERAIAIADEAIRRIAGAA